MNTTETPLRAALVAAVELSSTTKGAWLECDCAESAGPCAHHLAWDAAWDAVAPARAALAASGELRPYTLRDGGGGRGACAIGEERHNGPLGPRGDTMTKSKRSAGRPPKAASALAAGTRAGTRRFSIELPEHLLVELDERALRNERSRNAEIRVLLGETLRPKKRSPAP